MKQKYIIGIDEVGRGPLAGPVTVAAVAVADKLKLKTEDSKLKLKDSKKLTPKQREKWFKFVKENKIPFAIANVRPKTIDKINISRAANLAATRATLKLLATSELATRNLKILLDGGLYINLKSSKKLLVSGYLLNTIVRGDEKIPAIALASIMAKVHRDRLMKRLHKKFPQYGFDKHKGYGTKLHFQTIKKSGVSEIHRKNFLKNI